MDFDELESLFSEKTKALIFNNPNNPLGKVYKRDELEKVADLAKKYNVVVITDEVYEHMVSQFYLPELVGTEDDHGTKI